MCVGVCSVLNSPSLLSSYPRSCLNEPPSRRTVFMFEFMAAPRFYMTHCNGLANLQLEAGSIINFTGGLFQLIEF